MSSYTVSKAQPVRFNGVASAASAASSAAKGAAAGAAVGTVIPVIGNIAGGVIGGIVGSISGLNKGNIAAARAADKANQDKAVSFLTSSSSGNRMWGAEYIVKNPSFYSPDTIAMALVAVGPISGGTLTDYNDPVGLNNMLNYLRTTPVTDLSNKMATFIYTNQDYYMSNPALIDVATAYMQSGGKSRDIQTLAQPTVNVSAGALVNQPTMQSVYGGPSATGINKASMFSGNMLPIILVSGAVIAVAYKFFSKKKGTSGRRRK